MTFQERVEEDKWETHILWAQRMAKLTTLSVDDSQIKTIGRACWDAAFTAGAHFGVKLERERVELLSAAIDSCCKCTEDPLRERHSLLCNIPLVKAEIAKWKETE